ncbi:ATP-binding protein [Cognatishimia maritima]|uniref:Serine/threonine-protein kinase RsbW n=1 Tax=Cognatishimia maritima TaxID=870908 RepID=A0A1M5SYJ2_9RHOB|nr:ATP-binding protein [Cognatishimia maritima]SHH43263.1 serine/threonine-protein kinase RsbW [Cognatishimia maritima]
MNRVSARAGTVPRSGEISFRSPSGATLKDMRHAVMAIIAELQSSGFRDDEISDAEIVLGELLSNIVKHAHLGRANGWFFIQVRYSDDALLVECHDNGSAMPQRRVPDGRFPNTARPTNMLPEGGWGWCLIRALSNDICYERSANENVTRLVLPIFPSAH